MNSKRALNLKMAMDNFRKNGTRRVLGEWATCLANEGNSALWKYSATTMRVWTSHDRLGELTILTTCCRSLWTMVDKCLMCLAKEGELVVWEYTTATRIACNSQDISEEVLVHIGRHGSTCDCYPFQRR